MSLINKMLQDLEERRSEGDVASTIHAQLRAAPEQKKVHVAWWVAAGLALILTGVISWLWGRQTAPTIIMAQPSVQPQLALKLAPGLSVAQPSSLKNSAIDAKSDALPAVAVQPISEAKEGNIQIAPNNLPSTTVQANIANKIPNSNSLPLAITPSVALMPAATPASSPATVRSITEALPRVPVPAKDRGATQIEKPDTTSDFELPTNVSKQMRDLTPPQRAENEYRKATFLIQQGKTTDAINILEQTLQIDPQHSVARQTLVGLLLENKRQDEAVRKLQEGLNLERNQPALAMMLARLQIERNDLRPAIETLQRTLPYAADRADYQAFLAALFQRDARHKEAIEHYLLALRKAPQNGLWWMGLAISLQAENRIQESRDAFVRAKASSTLSPELTAFVDQKLNQLR